MSKHERYSPSRLPLLAECPGFVGGATTVHAERGTAFDAKVTRSLQGAEEDFGEMEENAEFLGEILARVRQWVGDEPTEHVQEFFPGVIPGNGGTPDMVFHNAFDRRAAVVDTKTGWGYRPTRGGADLQLLSYGLNVAHALQADTILLVRVETDQRRYSWDAFGEADLRAEAERIEAVIRTVQEAGNRPSSWKQGTACRYCIRYVTCPATEKTITTAPATEVFAPADADRLDPQACAGILREHAGRIEAAHAAIGKVKARAFALLAMGIAVPGWKLAPGRSERVWVAGAADTVTDVFGPDAIQTEIKSPAQIEKIRPCPNGMKPKDVKALVKSLTATIQQPNARMVPDGAAAELEGEEANG